MESSFAVQTKFTRLFSLPWLSNTLLTFWYSTHR